MAEKIVMKNGQLQVSNRPIITFIEGDGVDKIVHLRRDGRYEPASSR